jgi:hypothetical protein
MSKTGDWGKLMLCSCLCCLDHFWPQGWVTDVGCITKGRPRPQSPSPSQANRLKRVKGQPSRQNRRSKKEQKELKAHRQRWYYAAGIISWNLWKLHWLNVRYPSNFRRLNVGHIHTNSETWPTYITLHHIIAGLAQAHPNGRPWYNVSNGYHEWI